METKAGFAAYAAGALLGAVLVLTGCQKQAETTTPVGAGFNVDKLFTVDGCTVYRFSDAGRPRYFTNCSGSTEWMGGFHKNPQPEGVQGGRP